MVVDDANNQRSDAEIIFDEQSARQLAEIVRAIARDRGVQAAAVTVSADEDRKGVRFVVCAPCATSEADFGLAVGKAVASEMRIVVEHDCGGLLHIFNPEQLRRRA